MNLSQEELAEKVFVTRQTISNWENNKNYPDIHSLLLLSTLFNVSLDQLIKGDINQMKVEINKVELHKFNRYKIIYSALLLLFIFSIVPLTILLGIPGLLISFSIWTVAMFFALKVEKFKKNHDIQTYKEIVAFSEGKQLDEIEKAQEYGKRPYQKFLLAFSFGLFALLVCIVISWLMTGDIFIGKYIFK